MTDIVSISNTVFLMLGLELLFSIALPVVAVILWKKKTDASLSPLLMGAAAFFVFAMVIEQIIHFLVLGLNGSVSAFILSRPWLYAVYGGFMAGFIEESARFLVFKTMMRQHIGRENAVTYGLGHGAIECICILGMSMVSNLLLALMFNTMGAEAFIAQYSPGQTEAVTAAIAAINAVDPFSALLACFERACAMALQVELSVLVFAAVRLNKVWLYPVSILLHMLIDFFAAFYQTGAITQVWIIEAGLFVYVVALFFVVRRVYQKLPAEGPTKMLDHFGRVVSG